MLLSRRIPEGSSSLRLASFLTEACLDISLGTSSRAASAMIRFSTVREANQLRLILVCGWLEREEKGGQEGGRPDGGHSHRDGRGDSTERHGPSEGSGLPRQEDHAEVQREVRLEPQALLLPRLQGATLPGDQREGEAGPGQVPISHLRRMRPREQEENHKTRLNIQRSGLTNSLRGKRWSVS